MAKASVKKLGVKGEETKQRLMEAGLRVFALRGFDGASTRQIATLAGENQGLVTYYFGNKDGLWRASVEMLFGGLREQLLSRLETLMDADVRTRMRLLLFFFVRYAARHPEQMRLMVMEGQADTERSRWLVETHIKPMFGLFEGLIMEAQEAGVLPMMPVIHFFYIMIGSTSLIFTHALECEILSGRSPLSQEMIDAHAEAVCAVLLPSAAASVA